LCRSYWYPLYAFARKRGVPAADVEDLVQGFFTHLIEGDALRYADHRRGRFRGFIVAAFQQFQARRHEYESAAKRSPPGHLVPIDVVAGEARYSKELAAPGHPDRSFEYAWAVTVLQRALDRLRVEYEAEGRLDRFEALRGFVTGVNVLEYAALAPLLGGSAGAARVAAHRFRQRYAALVREEVGATLDDGESVEVEIGELLAAVRLGPSS